MFKPPTMWELMVDFLWMIGEMLLIILLTVLSAAVLAAIVLAMGFAAGYGWSLGHG
jgi:hypothetical protein